jgi:hypothetical protein
MKKRPKSREETPKEGSGNAERYRTATICRRDAQSARAFEPFPMQNTHGSIAYTETQIQFL